MICLVVCLVGAPEAVQVFEVDLISANSHCDVCHEDLVNSLYCRLCKL